MCLRNHKKLQIDFWSLTQPQIKRLSRISSLQQHLFFLNKLRKSHVSERWFCLRVQSHFYLKKRKNFFSMQSWNMTHWHKIKSMFSHIIPWYIHAWLQSLLLQGPHSFGSSVKQWLKLRYVRRLELVVGCEFSPTWSLGCQQRWICRPQCRRPHAWQRPPSLLVGSPGQRKHVMIDLINSG